MSYYISSTIQVGATASEWAEIKAAFANGNIDWTGCIEGPHFYDREIKFSNKSTSPMYDGSMDKLSKLFPTVRFYYLAQGEDERRPSFTWYVNGKDGEKKAAEIELKKAYKDAISRAALANGRVAEGITNRVELMPDGRVAADGENRFGECNVLFWKDVKQISCGNWHTVGLTGDGKAIACGSNENGQCDFSTVQEPITQISCGRYHTALLLSSGRVVVCGHLEQKATFPQADKKETGPLNQTNYVQTTHKKWKNIKRIVSVYDAVIGLSEDNSLFIDGYCPCEENELRSLFDLSPININPAKAENKQLTSIIKQHDVDANQPFSYKTIDSIPESFFEGVLLEDKKGKIVLNKPKKKELEFDVNGNRLKITVGLAAKLNSLWKNYYEYITGNSDGECDEYDGVGTLYDPIDAAEKSESEMHGTDEETGSYIGYSVPRDTEMLSDEQIRNRVLLFLKLCILCSNEDVAKCVVEAAPKKKNGTFAKNRITHIATLFCSTSYCGTTELVGIAKDDTEMQLAIRDASLNYHNIEAVYSDLASTTNLFRGFHEKPVLQDKEASEVKSHKIQPKGLALNEQEKPSPVQIHESDKPQVREEKTSISRESEKKAVTKLSITFPVAEVEPNRRKMLDQREGKTDGSNHFDLFLHTWNSSHGVALYYYDKIWPTYSKTKEELLKTADEFVKLFRDETQVCDVESELRQGLIRNGRTIHVLRSFVWTSVEYCAKRKKQLQDFDIQQSLQLAQFIFERGGANYNSTDKKAKRVGAGLLAKSEKDHGFSGESYFNMITSLTALSPIMRRVHDYFCEKKGTLSDAEVTLKDVLAGWCVYALACFGEFRVEAGPEDCVPEKCRTLPADNGNLRIIDKCYYVDQNNVCVAYTGSGDTIAFPEGIERINIPSAYSNISGSKEYWEHTGTVILPKTCSVGNTVNSSFSRELKRLVIKGNVDSIDSKFSYNNEPVWLEQLELLGSGNTVHSYAFSDYPQLRLVILPESLHSIETGAFNRTPMLKEIRIPPSVTEIGYGAFTQNSGNTTALIVEKGSPAEEVVRKFVDGRKDLTCKVVLSEAEKKRIEEENRLKRIATTLQQELTTMYQDRLDRSQFDSLKKAVSISLSNICDKQTWIELCNRNITALPVAYLKETSEKLSKEFSPEDAYALLPEWIATEYIKTAEEKRARLAREAEERRTRLEFQRVLQDLDNLANESALSLVESGVEKEVIIEQITSRANSIVENIERFNSGLSKFNGDPTLKTLRDSLSRLSFASAEEVIRAIADKKSTEIDRLVILLEKKNSELGAIQQEKIKLEEERSHLGFFRRNRRKEIDALLAAIPERIQKIEAEYEIAKNSINYIR